jgi:hypothetical protein
MLLKPCRSVEPRMDMLLSDFINFLHSSAPFVCCFFFLSLYFPFLWCPLKTNQILSENTLQQLRDAGIGEDEIALVMQEEQR